MSELSYTELFDVSYRKVEVESNPTTGVPAENWVIIGKAFRSHKGIITLRLDAMPIELFWPSRKLVLYPKEIKQAEEPLPPTPPPAAEPGTGLTVSDVPQGTFFKLPNGRVTYMRIGNSINYPFNLDRIVFGVNRNGSARQFRVGDSVVASTYEAWVGKEGEDV